MSLDRRSSIIAVCLVLAFLAPFAWLIVGVIRNEPNRKASYVSRCMSETGWPQRTCEWMLHNNRQ